VLKALAGRLIQSDDADENVANDRIRELESHSARLSTVLNG
jgi:hypothetical protein